MNKTTPDGITPEDIALSVVDELVVSTAYLELLSELEAGKDLRKTSAGKAYQKHLRSTIAGIRGPQQDRPDLIGLQSVWKAKKPAWKKQNLLDWLPG